ncbi:MAG: oligosaccharide flippase family protein [Bacteroidetes bacterium]|nr:oligosaccharide flippase family protein [Bacteroidota bacterium]
MNLRDHLNKGVWAAADKAILLVYGVAVIFVVIMVLPEHEYAAFTIWQTIFLIICVLSDSVFLQPMVKFASEHEAEVEQILAASFNLYSLVMVVSGVIFAVTAGYFSDLYHMSELYDMLLWMPLALLLNIFRGIGIRFLQVDYRIREIFWVDLAYYGSMIFLTVLLHSLGMFHSAMDFMRINVIGGVLSSIVAFVYGRSGFLAMPLLRVPRGEYRKLLSFAKYQAGTSAFLTLQQWADPLLIGVYAPGYVALFSAAKTLYRGFDAVREGATLLIVPVVSKMHTAGDKQQLSDLIEKMLFISFAVLVPVSLVLAIGADPILAIIYKGKFPGITPVFELLVITGFILPLVLVATNVLIAIGQVKGLFYSVLAATIVFFGLNRLLDPTMHAEGAALAVLISTGVMGILAFISMRRELSISARGVMRQVRGVRNKI